MFTFSLLGFVMVIQEKDQVQLKIVKQQYRGSVKRASDMKMKVELYRVSKRIHLSSSVSATYTLIFIKLIQWLE